MIATVQATEEAIINALVAAETMTGRDDNVFYAIPHERLRSILKKNRRLDVKSGPSAHAATPGAAAARQ